MPDPDERERGGVTRRGFVKWTAIGTAVVGGGLAAGVGGTVAYRLGSASQRLEERDRLRPEEGWEWFTASEAASMAALANVVIPPAPDGPGAADAGVVRSLDRRFAVSPEEGQRMARGLIGFDRLAEEMFGRDLSQLPQDSRRGVVSRAEEMYRAKEKASGGWIDALEHKTDVVDNLMDGVESAADVFPSLVRWVREAFYASPEAWEWLGYEGPPFPRGYSEPGSGCEAPEVATSR